MPINWKNVEPSNREYVRANMLHPGFEARFTREKPHWFSDQPASTSGHASQPTLTQQVNQHTSAQAAAEGQPPEKIQRVEADSSQSAETSQENAPTNVTSSTDSEFFEADMPLTGTAKGQGGSGDGNANGAMPLYKQMAPFSNFGKKISTYRKVHRFQTFAIAPNLMTVDTSPKQVWISTALAEIPWDRVPLYMNKSEFDLLPVGSYCKEVRISIVHRGTRIAFETSATTSSRATLNQVQNSMVAFGLNKTGYGVNRTYTQFDNPSQPMIPTNFNSPSYSTMDVDLYGSEQSLWGTAPYAHHQLGLSSPLKNYFMVCSSVAISTGVPPIFESVNVMDGKTTIDKVVGSFTYNPKIGSLKVPIRTFRTGLPLGNEDSVALQIPTNGSRVDGVNASVTVNTADSTGVQATLSADGIAISNTFTNMQGVTSYFDMIEKSQTLKQGPWGQYESCQIQPSIHIGIQAIPTLTATQIFTPVDSWTDAQADWDVVCEMDVVEHTPTSFPLAIVPNVPPGKVMYRTTNNTPNAESCTYAGLYVTNDIPYPV